MLAKPSEFVLGDAVVLGIARLDVGFLELLEPTSIGLGLTRPNIDQTRVDPLGLPTLGTRLTGERNTATRLIVRDGALSAVPSPPPTSIWQFPEPFGSQPVTCVALSEIITLSRHVKAGAITSYMTLKPLADLADRTTPPPRGSDAFGRSDQLFAMSVRAERAVEIREATVSGRDIYAVTAPLVVEACVRLLDGATPAWAGVRSPGEVFDARAFLAALDDVLTPQPIPSPSLLECNR